MIMYYDGDIKELEWRVDLSFSRVNFHTIAFPQESQSYQLMLLKILWDCTLLFLLYPAFLQLARQVRAQAEEKFIALGGRTLKGGVGNT